MASPYRQPGVVLDDSPVPEPPRPEQLAPTRREAPALKSEREVALADPGIAALDALLAKFTGLRVAAARHGGKRVRISLEPRE
jgi:hypothetical protein